MRLRGGVGIDPREVGERRPGGPLDPLKLVRKPGEDGQEPGCQVAAAFLQEGGRGAGGGPLHEIGHQAGEARRRKEGPHPGAVPFGDLNGTSPARVARERCSRCTVTGPAGWGSLRRISIRYRQRAPASSSAAGGKSPSSSTVSTGDSPPRQASSPNPPKALTARATPDSPGAGVTRWARNRRICRRLLLPGLRSPPRRDAPQAPGHRGPDRASAKAGAGRGPAAVGCPDRAGRRGEAPARVGPTEPQPRPRVPTRRSGRARTARIGGVSRRAGARIGSAVRAGADMSARSVRAFPGEPGAAAVGAPRVAVPPSPAGSTGTPARRRSRSETRPTSRPRRGRGGGGRRARA